MNVEVNLIKEQTLHICGLLDWHYQLLGYKDVQKFNVYVVETACFEHFKVCLKYLR